MPAKVDLKRELADYRAKRDALEVVEVPPRSYLVLDGAGDPNTSPLFADSVATLFPVAYQLKFLSKLELGRDHVVMPLEGLWWSDDMETFTGARDKRRWSWRLMVLTPGWLGRAHVDEAGRRAGLKGPPARLSEVRWESLDEGTCVQALHLGSYDDEGALLERMHDDFIPARGLRMTGRHHEIYLSDARRTAPEKLRTILRQPVARAT